MSCTRSQYPDNYILAVAGVFAPPSAEQPVPTVTVTTAIATAFGPTAGNASVRRKMKATAKNDLVQLTVSPQGVEPQIAFSNFAYVEPIPNDPGYYPYGLSFAIQNANVYQGGNLVHQGFVGIYVKDGVFGLAEMAIWTTLLAPVESEFTISGYGSYEPQWGTLYFDVLSFTSGNNILLTPPPPPGNRRVRPPRSGRGPRLRLELSIRWAP
jgi:hypothetical protein